jgi:hypothetical protein
VLDQPAARHRADGDAEARHGGPDADRLRPLLGGEDVRQDGQGGRHDERAADAHQGAAGDQHVGARGDGRDNRGGAEHHQARHEGATAAEAVPEGTHREQQAREDEGV